LMLYPVTSFENTAIRWAARIVPTVAVAVILFLGTLSVCAWAG